MQAQRKMREAEDLPMVMPDFSEENLARLQAATDFRCDPASVQRHSPPKLMRCSPANSSYPATMAQQPCDNPSGLGLLNESPNTAQLRVMSLPASSERCLPCLQASTREGTSLQACA